MKKILFTIAMALVASTAAQAQSFLDFLKSDSVKDVVENVTGGQNITVSNIAGTWNYVKPAVKLEGDNVLNNATGTLAATQMENTLNKYCSKVGITADAFSYTFNKDNTFSCNIKGRSLRGTYSIDSNSKTVTLNFSIIGTINLGTMEAQASLLGKSLSLLFNADKLLEFFSKVATSTNNSALNIIGSASKSYEGMLLGFELEK